MAAVNNIIIIKLLYTQYYFFHYFFIGYYIVVVLYLHTNDANMNRIILLFMFSIVISTTMAEQKKS